MERYHYIWWVKIFLKSQINTSPSYNQKKNCTQDSGTDKAQQQHHIVMCNCTACREYLFICQHMYKYYIYIVCSWPVRTMIVDSHRLLSLLPSYIMDPTVNNLRFSNSSFICHAENIKTLDLIANKAVDSEVSKLFTVTRILFLGRCVVLFSKCHFSVRWSLEAKLGRQKSYCDGYFKTSAVSCTAERCLKLYNTALILV